MLTTKGFASGREVLGKKQKGGSMGRAGSLGKTASVVRGYTRGAILSLAISCAAFVARTLTNLYNARPTWFDLAHKRLDEAVFAAYGWKSDLSDEEILEKLLALNLERAKK